MMAALCGLLAGFTYHSNLFNVRKLRVSPQLESCFTDFEIAQFPAFVNRVISSTVGRVLAGTNRPMITMHSRRGTRHRQSQNAGQSTQTRGVVASEEAVQQLMSMGFEEDRVRTALQMTNNDIQSAIAMLVDRG